MNHHDGSGEIYFNTQHSNNNTNNNNNNNSRSIEQRLNPEPHNTTHNATRLNQSIHQNNSTTLPTKGAGVKTRTTHRSTITIPTPPPPPPVASSQPHNHIPPLPIDIQETLENDVPLDFWCHSTNLRNLQLHTDEYPLPSSPSWKAAGEWSNWDIDAITTQWQTTDATMYVLHATFLLDAQKQPIKAREQLQQAAATIGPQGKIHMICWIRHHWVAATFHQDRMELADSAPGIATGQDIRTIADFVGASLDKSYTVIEMKIPRQPKNSAECGSHCVANLFMNNQGWLLPREQSDRNPTVLTYANLNEIFTLYAAGEVRHSFVNDRILETIGEHLFHLIKHDQILRKVDNFSDAPITVRWMSEEGLKKWTGTLYKRNANNWAVKYKEMEVMGTLPNKDICYLTVEQEGDTGIWTADLESLNVRPPPSTVKAEGDTTTIRRLKEILNLPRQTPPFNEYFTRATAQTTRAHHVQILNTLKTMPPILDNQMITQGIPTFINRQRIQRRWKASTTLTKLASIQGMLKVLPYYIQGAPSIMLNTSVQWRTTLRGATIMANTETPDQCLPMKNADLYTLMERTPNPEMRALLELAWLTAGRIGDMLKLTPQNIKYSPAGVTMVQFTDGKTARNGSYSIACPPITEQTADFLRSSRNNLHLFPNITTDLFREEVRNIDIRYECRSIRRGRLQMLSLGGMSDNSLLHTSRHSNICSLRRYLDFGLASGENLYRARQATKAAILAERQIERPSSTYNPTAAQDAPPVRTSREPSPHWLNGRRQSSQSDQSPSESASGDE